MLNLCKNSIKLRNFPFIHQLRIKKVKKQKHANEKIITCKECFYVLNVFVMWLSMTGKNQMELIISNPVVFLVILMSPDIWRNNHLKLYILLSNRQNEDLSPTDCLLLKSI